jgi:hypothetical protein
MFNLTDDCFGHAWMANGTATTSMGAVNIIGPTWNTHTTCNNWLDRGMYRGYVYWEMYQSVPMMNYGKAYMLEQLPEEENQTINEITFRTFIDFGTPDLWIRTGFPRTIVTGLAYGYSDMSRYISVRDSLGDVVDHGLVSWTANGSRWVLEPDDDGGVPTGLSSVSGNKLDVVVSGNNLIPLQTLIPWTTGTTGSLVITEIKPDIPTDGTQGDKIELYNSGATTVDLQGWIVTDLDGYDIPFVTESCLLYSQQLAVIEFLGPMGEQSITRKPYGVLIESQAIPDFSSLEAVAALRNPLGQIVDSLAWTDLTGASSTNAASDMSKVTGSTSPIQVLDSGWWNAPDEITQDTYEQYAVDWSPFAGMGGNGSIQRCNIATPDGKGNFTVQSDPGFGSYYHTSASVAGAEKKGVLH